jgi:hypothetical protein
MMLVKSIKHNLSELIHHFGFTYWVIVWIYAAALSGFIWIFSTNPFQYNVKFEFFAYQNSPSTIFNLWFQQLLLIFISCMLGFLIRNKLAKINTLLGLFSMLVLIAMTILFFPIILSILTTPKAI